MNNDKLIIAKQQAYIKYLKQYLTAFDQVSIPVLAFESELSKLQETKEESPIENESKDGYIKDLCRFFDLEADLKFCTRKYAERVKWYFNNYGVLEQKPMLAPQSKH